jgi:hypothetical protein
MKLTCIPPAFAGEEQRFHHEDTKATKKVFAREARGNRILRALRVFVVQIFFSW